MTDPPTSAPSSAELPDPLDRFWVLFETPDALLGAQEAACWPPGALATLLDLGLLMPAATATQVVCTACADRHVERVERVLRPDGRCVFRIPCPECGCAEVADADLRQWQPDLKLFARRLKELLGLDSRVREHVPGRVWRLGSGKWGKRNRESFLVRGLEWSDGAEVAASIPCMASPVVFVGLQGLPSVPWPSGSPAVVLLPTVLSCTPHTGVVFDHSMLAWWIASADEAMRLGLRAADDEVRRRVDRLVEDRLSRGGKAELIQAFDRQGMSDRAIAEEMAKRGVPIHPSTVNRKKRRLVDPADVPRPSKSIVRGPSSQPRNTRGRPISDAEPKKE